MPSIFLDPLSNQKEILLADLQTAKWIERINSYTDLEQLAEHFIYYHHHLSQTIMGTTVKRLEKIDKLFLGMVIQKWATLYLTALRQLRIYFPLGSAPGLTVNGKNWSEILLMSSAGLTRLANESRYAEYWAEKSLSNSAVYDSYTARLEFLTTDLYLQLSQLKLTGSLTIYDSANLGVTAYDIAEAVYESPDPNLIKYFRSLGGKSLVLMRTQINSVYCCTSFYGNSKTAQQLSHSQS